MRAYVESMNFETESYKYPTTLIGSLLGCNDPPVKNLISIGGPQQGVYGLPHCMGATWTVCEYIRELLDYGVYTSFVQNNLVQAEYWQVSATDYMTRDSYSAAM